MGKYEDLLDEAIAPTPKPSKYADLLDQPETTKESKYADLLGSTETAAPSKYADLLDAAAPEPPLDLPPNLGFGEPPKKSPWDVARSVAQLPRATMPKPATIPRPIPAAEQPDIVEQPDVREMSFKELWDALPAERKLQLANRGDDSEMGITGLTEDRLLSKPSKLEQVVGGTGASLLAIPQGIHDAYRKAANPVFQGLGIKQVPRANFLPERMPGVPGSVRDLATNTVETGLGIAQGAGKALEAVAKHDWKPEDLNPLEAVAGAGNALWQNARYLAGARDTSPISEPSQETSIWGKLGESAVNLPIGAASTALDAAPGAFKRAFESIGNAWTGESKVEADSLAELALNSAMAFTGEVVNLAGLQAQIANAAAGGAKDVLSGVPAEQAARPFGEVVADTGAGMAAGVTEMALDPYKAVERGPMNVHVNAGLLARPFGRLSQVGENPRRFIDASAAYENAATDLGPLAGEHATLVRKEQAREYEVPAPREAYASAKVRAQQAVDAFDGTDAARERVLNAQAQEAAARAEYVKADEAHKAAQAALAEFHAAKGKDLQDYAQKAAEARKELDSAAVEQDIRRYIAQGGMVVGTAGLKLVKDAVALGINRMLTMEGRYATGREWFRVKAQQLLKPPSSIPIAQAQRALVREVKGRPLFDPPAAVDDLVAAMPDDVKPILTDVFQAQLSADEGGFWTPDNTSDRHWMEYDPDAKQFVQTKYGKEQVAAIQRDLADPSLPPEKHAELQSQLDRFNARIDIGNKWGVPHAERTRRITEAALQEGVLTEQDVAGIEEARKRVIDSANDRFATEKARLEKRTAKQQARLRYQAERIAKEQGIVGEAGRRRLAIRAARDTKRTRQGFDRAADLIARMGLKPDVRARLIDDANMRYMDSTLSDLERKQADKDAPGNARYLIGRKVDAALTTRLKDIHDKYGQDRAAEVAAWNNKPPFASLTEAQKAKGEHMRALRVLDSQFEKDVRSALADASQQMKSASARLIGPVGEKRLAARQKADARKTQAVYGQETALIDKLDVPAAEKQRLLNREAEATMRGFISDEEARRLDEQVVAGAESRAGRMNDNRFARQMTKLANEHNAALEKLTAERDARIEAARQRITPEGLRSLWWPQVYDEPFVRERKAKTPNVESKSGVSKQGDISADTQTERVLKSEGRSEAVSVSKRRAEWGLKSDFDAEVKALHEMEQVVENARLHREMADMFAKTEEQLDEARAVEVQTQNALAAGRGKVGLTERQGAARDKLIDRKYIKVPEDTLIPNDKRSNAPKKWGALAGKYIPIELLAQLQAVQDAIDSSKEPLTRLWNVSKLLKTSWSVATGARNVMTNALLHAPMNDIAMWVPANKPHYERAFSDIVSAKKRPMYEEAMTELRDSLVPPSELGITAFNKAYSGAFETATGPFIAMLRAAYMGVKAGVHGASKSEIKARIQEPFTRELLERQQNDPGAYAKTLRERPLPKAGAEAREATRQFGKAVSDAVSVPGEFYRTQDLWFKLAKWYQLREGKGYTREQARAYFAEHRPFLDYGDNPGFVQVFRAPTALRLKRGFDAKPNQWTRLFAFLGQPFLSYTVAATPAVLQYAERNPVGYLIARHMASAMTRQNLAALGMTKEDSDAIDAMEPAAQRTMGLVGKYIPSLAYDPETGNLRTIDEQFLSIGGSSYPQRTPDYLNTVEKWRAALKSALPIGPGPVYSVLVDLMNNNDSFTGRTMISDGADDEHQLSEIAEYMLRSYLPIYGQKEKLRRAAEGQPDSAGRVRSYTQALLQVFAGLKSAQFSPIDATLAHMTVVGSQALSAEKQAKEDNNIELNVSQMGENDYTRWATTFTRLMKPRATALAMMVRKLAATPVGQDEMLQELSDALDELSATEKPVEWVPMFKHIMQAASTALSDRRALVNAKSQTIRNAAR